MSNERVVDFNAVDIGNCSELPPDAPAGGWTGLCSVKKGKTAKDGYPMLILEWKLMESEDTENQFAVGSKIADFVTFFPRTHKAVRMSRMKLKALCDGLGVSVPTATKIESWDDISDFIDALDGMRTRIWTTVAPDRATGQPRTSLHYTVPMGQFSSSNSEPTLVSASSSNTVSVTKKKTRKS